MLDWSSPLLKLGRILPFMLAIIRVIPVLIVVALNAVTWAICAFLPKERQEFVLQLIDKLMHWTYGIPATVAETEAARLSSSGGKESDRLTISNTESELGVSSSAKD